MVRVGTHVYPHFADPDGADAAMSVQLEIRHVTGSGRRITPIQTQNSGSTIHGVYVHADVSKYGISPGTVGQYAFRATDEDGLKSAWTVVGSAC
jgi:hypothetical protein